MKARFEVRSIKAQWKPPFKKEITDEVFDVNEGESFDRIIGNGNDESVFNLISAINGIAKVKYSKLFTQKTGNPGSYELELAKDSPVEMTYLWGEDGVTKKITYRGVASGEAPSQNETENSTDTSKEVEEKKDKIIEI